MKKLFLPILTILCLFACDSNRSVTTTTTTTKAEPVATTLSEAEQKAKENAAGIYRYNPKRPMQKPDPQIEALLQQMTLKEKIGQMTQLMADMVLDGPAYNPTKPFRIDPVKMKQVIQEYGVGSILNTPNGQLLSPTEWRTLLGGLHEATQQTRLKIPVLFGYDAIHGVNYVKDGTLYPQPLGMAATWNVQLAEECAEICAYETRAAGVHWNFSPAMDLARNPVNPRTWESFGEDVHMNTQFGAATIRGYRGNDPSEPEHVGTCLKHFTGYMPTGGKDRTPAWISERYLREYFLQQYIHAMKQNPIAVMINSGEVNGIPAHADKWLLTDLLRDELGFQGIAITDWNDIPYLYERHRTARDFKEAVYQAIDAGIDMSMTPQDLRFPDALYELVQEGKISEERINQSVRRILIAKKQVGLFDNFVFPAENYPKFGGPEFKQKAYEAASESIVLLKNNEVNGAPILPLTKSTRVLVTGPTANTLRSLNGGWTYDWQGTKADELAPADKLTVAESIQMKVGDTNYRYQVGVTADGNTDNLAGAVEVAKAVDVIVLCLGEQSYTEDWGNTNSLLLPKEQLELAEAMLATGKPVVLLMLQGRPRIINTIADRTAANLWAIYPGMEGGRAMADILFGTVNPSGKLPLTYPRFANSFMSYDRKGTEDRDVNVSGKTYDPQYEFGHGLSYTNFEYSNLTTSATQEALTVSVMVRNTGSRPGKEAVPVYVSDLVASITPSAKRLRAFDKVLLQPGASQTLKFEIPLMDLGFVGRNNQWRFEAGEFTVRVGDLDSTLFLGTVK